MKDEEERMKDEGERMMGDLGVVALRVKSG